MPTRELFGMRLREHQARILDYPQHPGLLGVSAVPGSGKTQTLALLAAELIVDGHLDTAGVAEVLVVTVQNSAVDQIAARIRKILADQGLPPVGFHVCTLHKLASDILRERYDLAGVEDGFGIIDETEARRTMQNAANVWITSHLTWWESFIPEGSERERTNVTKYWREETEKVGREVSKLCKHLRMTPDEAQALLDKAAKEGADELGDWLPMGVGLYAQYARLLQARNGLDFDDLIWRAIDALQQDTTFAANLRARWPFILEDEAQDSSPLQQMILECLAGEQQHWVRVGDPNQAINSTFTSADPRFFRQFIARPDVAKLPLAESGRSGRPIIALANYLVQWACREHPEPDIRTLAFEPQEIYPTGPGDPQANPPDEQCHIHLREQPFENTDAEATRVAEWAADYVRRHDDYTVAVLCPTQRQGSQVVEALQAVHPPVPVEDHLQSTPQTRDVARVLSTTCSYLAAPMSSSRLADLYGILVQGGYLQKAGKDTPELKTHQAWLRSLAPARLAFPREAGPLTELLPPSLHVDQVGAEALAAYARLVRRWVSASSLAIDQLLLTVAQDLFTDDADLAICHLLATSLGSAGQMHPNWRLSDYSQELREIAANCRAFGGLSLADVGYEPQKGHIVVTTLHKAKGLEWDGVFILCADNLEFPDTREGAFRDEPYFMPGRAPAVEACRLLERLDVRLRGSDQQPESVLPAQAGIQPERSLLEEARLEYIAERLRLLYVGITRARRDLSVTWSRTNGRRSVQRPAALIALQRFVNEKLAGQTV